MEIEKIKNYKQMADMFKDVTKCDEVKIKIMPGHNHYHFGMIKNGLPIAVICYNTGDITIAPFEDVDNQFSDDCYLDPGCFPIFDDFVTLMNGIRPLIVDNCDEI